MLLQSCLFVESLALLTILNLLDGPIVLPEMESMRSMVHIVYLGSRSIYIDSSRTYLFNIYSHLENPTKWVVKFFLHRIIYVVIILIVASSSTMLLSKIMVSNYLWLGLRVIFYHVLSRLSLTFNPSHVNKRGFHHLCMYLKVKPHISNICTMFHL